MTNYFVCMGQNYLVINKMSLAINNTTNTIYMFLLKSYVGAICGCVLIICSTTATIQTFIRYRKEKLSATDLDSKNNTTTTIENQ